MRLHKLIATALGIGYIGKGGGTVAAIATCIVWYFAAPEYGLAFTVPFTLLTTIIGIWSATKVEILWGKDDKKVVIDEVSGMCISLLFVPLDKHIEWVILCGLVLFRFFDILKPLGIRKTEDLPGGWGVMIDDVLSGVYANIILRIGMAVMVMQHWL